MLTEYLIILMNNIQEVHVSNSGEHTFIYTRNHIGHLLNQALPLAHMDTVSIILTA